MTSFNSAGSTSPPPLANAAYAVAGVDGIAIGHQTALEKARRHERLGRRSRLERFGERGGGRLTRIQPTARHRKDVAAVRIENDDVAALGAHARNRVGQRLFRD